MQPGRLSITNDSFFDIINVVIRFSRQGRTNAKGKSHVYTRVTWGKTAPGGNTAPVLSAK